VRLLDKISYRLTRLLLFIAAAWGLDQFLCM